MRRQNESRRLRRITLLGVLLPFLLLILGSARAFGTDQAPFQIHLPYVIKNTQSPLQTNLTIANISDNQALYSPPGIPQYEKFEITFDLENSVATNLQLPYDPSPPPGIDPDTNPLHKGISVDAAFTPDNWQTTYHQPAFYYRYYDDQIKSGREWHYPTGGSAWKVRFAPNKPGIWQYKIVARDSASSASSPVLSFTVAPSTNKGFISVSSRDTRYFEFDDGTPFYGLGSNDTAHLDDPIVRTEPYFQQYAKNNVNFLRIWISGMYGASWLEWLGGRNLYDGYLPRSGLEAFHDPIRNTDSLTQRLDYDPDGDTGWYDACRFQFWNDPESIKPNTNYKLRIKYWAMDIAGPRVAGYANYGLVGKMGSGWTPNCYEPGTGPIITNYGGNTADWGYLEGTWNSGNNNFLPRIYLGLENVTQGKVYVESISLTEDLGNGQYGPEIIAESSMQYELYFPEESAYSMDKVIELARQYGIYLKLVVEDKQDPINYKLDDDGSFVIGGEPDNQDGFYGLGRGINKTRWLQQAWWRYLQARWGYSPNIHSWELTNEGNPQEPKHWAMTDEFGKYMSCRVFGVEIASGDAQKCDSNHPNRHLVTTSFWHSFPATQFWNNANYPNVDYADVHAYISTSQIGLSAAELEKMQWDSAYYHTGHSIPLGGWRIGKPIVRGEAGIDSVGQQAEQPGLANDTQGIWLHKYLWSTVDPGGVYELYWWRGNLENRPGPDGEPGLYEVYAPFYGFIKDVPLNNGRYVDAAATASNANLRVFGQKDPVGGRAHLWIDNKNHYWKNVVDGVPVASESGTISFASMPPGTYRVSWYDTYAGVTTGVESLSVGTNGVVSLPVNSLATDIALTLELM